MGYCSKCGAPQEDGVKFCTSCGAPVNSGNAGAGPQQANVQPNAPVSPARGISFGQRNIAVAIILSIVTCGIYGIYWLIKIVDELNEAAGEPTATSGGVVFLLSIVTCGIYLLYWFYKAGERLNAAKSTRGLPIDSNAGIVYLILGLVGFSIISYALIQSELNKIAAYHGASAA